MAKKSALYDYHKIKKGLSIGKRTDHETGYYYASVAVQLKDGKTVYKRRSLGTGDKDQAVILAIELGKDLTDKAKSGSSVSKSLFIHTVFPDFMARKERQMKNKNITDMRFKIYLAFDENWFGKYFRKRENRTLLSGMTDATIESYWDWRMNYVGSDEHALDQIEQKREGIRTKNLKTPSPGYLENEWKRIREFFGWCVRQRYMFENEIPEALERRPAPMEESADGFTHDEYIKLKKYITGEWVHEVVTPSVRLIRQRIALKFKFMVECGTRVSDLIQLTWDDVNHEYNPETKETDYWFIAKAKGKRRMIMLMEEQYNELMIWKKKSKFDKGTDYVFATENGYSSESDSAYWSRMLKKIDMWEDSKKKGRTMTSLRHTFATFAILYSDASVFFLADRMGTSVQQIQATYADELRRRAKDKYSDVPIPIEHDIKKETERLLDAMFKAD